MIAFCEFVIDFSYQPFAFFFLFENTLTIPETAFFSTELFLFLRARPLHQLPPLLPPDTACLHPALKRLVTEVCNHYWDPEEEQSEDVIAT